MAVVSAAAAATALVLGRGTGRRHGASAAPPAAVVIVGAPAAPPAAGPLAVSRAFVAAYEQFIYGQLPADRLPDVSPYVRRQMATERPDPPAAVTAAADPRLRSLRLGAGAGRGRRQATAVVVDGPATYALRLALERRRGAWTVTGLAEAG
jgi:hypothetical protein